MKILNLRACSLFAALLGLTSATTSAVMIDPDGAGEVLLYPYYSVYLISVIPQ